MLLWKLEIGADDSRSFGSDGRFRSAKSTPVRQFNDPSIASFGGSVIALQNRSQDPERRETFPSAEFCSENARKKQFTTLVLCSELSTLPYGSWEKKRPP